MKKKHTNKKTKTSLMLAFSVQCWFIYSSGSFEETLVVSLLMFCLFTILKDTKHYYNVWYQVDTGLIRLITL